MKVLLAGRSGQLGVDLLDLLQKKGVTIIAPERREMDFLQAQSIRAAIRETEPDWVVNCAAYTRVDQAESERELAFTVNRDAVAVLAASAASVNARVLHVSTDFVFSGSASEPYREDDEAEPLSVYGQSKYEGELALLAAAPDSIILRTAWLYGAHGVNFVKTILRLAAERSELGVVADQYGSPTWTRDLAGAMWQLMQGKCSGIFHYVDEGRISWYEFACAIIEEARKLGFLLMVDRVKPLSTSQYPTAAKRPAYSVLSGEKIRAVLGQPIPYWRDSLRLMLKELQQCPDC